MSEEKGLFIRGSSGATWFRVFIKYCVFFQECSQLSFPPLPRQHSAAIGCTNYQPIGVANIAFRASKVSYGAAMKAREGLQ